MASIVFSATITATINTFDETAYRTNLASGLDGVSADDITLTVAGGSLIVTATIQASPAAATTLSSTVESWTPTQLAALLQVPVEAVSAPEVILPPTVSPPPGQIPLGDISAGQSIDGGNSAIQGSMLIFYIGCGGGLFIASIIAIVLCVCIKRSYSRPTSHNRAPIQPKMKEWIASPRGGTLNSARSSKSSATIGSNAGSRFDVCATSQSSNETEMRGVVSSPLQAIGMRELESARSQARSQQQPAEVSAVSQPLGSPRSPREKFRDRSKSVGSNKTSPVVPSVVPWPEPDTTTPRMEEKKEEQTFDPTAEFI